MDDTLTPDDRYYRLQAGWTRPHRNALYRRINLSGRRRVLDIGCADGFITEEIARKADGPVTGIDIDADAVFRGRARFPELDLRAEDACGLPFKKGEFDAVITSFTLMWIADPSRVLREVRRVLESGGLFLATGEPDHGGRIDWPKQCDVKQPWIDALSRQGADPFFGRKMASLISVSGLDVVDVGVLSSLWGGEEGEGRETYLDDLRLQLSDHVPDIEGLIVDERRAQDEGERLVFLPIFWAVAKKR
ncbi:MAG: class I SAM-dependent methyltransferase [Deltaproteobacteria bacterium]|nr:class I SAM-dependent methyltransferase [Candidatus Zymogenaceae bacterium]